MTFQIRQRAVSSGAQGGNRGGGGKAEGMAEAAGMTIDHLESVTENTGFDEYTVSTHDGAVSMKAEAAGTGIRSGSVSVTAIVTAVYEARK